MSFVGKQFVSFYLPRYSELKFYCRNRETHLARQAASEEGCKKCLPEKGKCN